MQEKKKSPWSKAKLLDKFDLPTQTICPYCGYVAERAMLAGSVGGHEPGAPEEGSVSICIECMRISIYDKNLQLVMLDWDKELALKRNPSIKHVLTVMRTLKRERAINAASNKE